MKRRYIFIIIALIAIVGVLYKAHVFDKPIFQNDAENIALEYSKEQMHQSYEVRVSQRFKNNYIIRLYPIKTPTLHPVDITIDVFTGKVVSFNKIK